MVEHYILDGDEAIPATQIGWAEWMRDNPDRKRVARTRLGESEVSTVFLGLNHAWGSGPPEIFETMVFGGVLSDECVRYSTMQEARVGHEQMCERVNMHRAAAFAFAD